MAYGLKYLSEFYNTPPFKKKVEVQISKRDFTGNVINVRTSSVLIESNFVDDDTSIIGKGAEISIVANSNDMTFLEDLLLSYEREFECVIIYDGEVAFRGYSLCDLNERQLLPYAIITVKFTDYLHRSEGQYPSTLQPMGGVSNLMSVIQSILIATDFDFPLYVNSTLFEDSMFDTPGDSFLTQVCVQNSVFYSSSFDYDNVYDAVNKALKSFNAYLYSHNDKWIIERLEDIGRDGDWVRYDPSDYQSDYDSSGGTSDDSVSTFGNLAGTNKWVGGVLAPNGCIYGIPYTLAPVLKIDTSDDSVSTFGNLPGGAKWWGGVLAPNGCIYGIPRASTTILKIDTSDDSVSTFGNLAGTNKWAGGVLAPNGCIYGIPYNSASVLKILSNYSIDENIPLARVFNKF
jgi:hypothetical protein